MESHKSEWFAYLLGAVLTLAWKWLSFCWSETKKRDVSMRSATKEWFFEETVSNAVSWVTTVGLVWAFGVLYLSNVTWSWFAWIKEIPVHSAIAFLMGSLMELFTPAIVRGIASKIPFADAVAYLKGRK